MLVHQDAEIVDPRFLRARPRRAERPGGRRWSAASARSACAASPGGRARSPAHRSSTATRSTAAATWHAFSWAWEDAPAYARTGEVETLDGFLLVLSPVGGPQHPLRRVARRASTATTSTLCLQVRAAGRKVVTADFRAIHHHPLEIVPRPRAVDRGAHQGRREVGRPDAASARGGQLARARAARRGRPRCGAAGRPRQPARVRGPGAPARAGARRATSSISLADHRAAARARCAGSCRPARWPRSGPLAGSRRDDRLRLLDQRRRAVPPLRASRASAGRPRPTRRSSPSRRSAPIGRSYNLLLDARRGPGGPGGAGAAPPLRRDRRSPALREGARRARRPRGRRDRRGGGDRGAQHRLVGGACRRGLGDATVIRSYGGRRSAGVLLGPGSAARQPRSRSSTAGCSCSRRGPCAMCASTSR